MIALEKNIKPTDIASWNAGMGQIKLIMIAAISTRHPAAINPLKNEKSFWDANAHPDKPKKIKAVPLRAVRTISLPD